MTIVNENSAIASLTAPLVSVNTELSFRVTVTDPYGASDQKNIVLTVNNVNKAPIANLAQTNLVVEEGELVTFDASSSSDPDGESLSFYWRQVSGPAGCHLTQSLGAASSERGSGAVSNEQSPDRLRGDSER